MQNQADDNDDVDEWGFRISASAAVEVKRMCMPLA
jgi:hypothetical protein